MGLFGNSGGGGGGLKLSINNYSGNSTVTPPKEIVAKYNTAFDRIMGTPETKTLRPGTGTKNPWTGQVTGGEYDVTPGQRGIIDTPWENYSNNPWDFVSPFNKAQNRSMDMAPFIAEAADPYITSAQLMSASGRGMLDASNEYGSYASRPVANYNIAAISDPYYQQGYDATGAAMSADGGYQAANGWFGGAGDYIGQGGRMTNQISGEDVGRYMTPYQQGVINPTLDLMKQSNEQAMQGALGNVIKGGGFGGDRAGVMMANINQQNQMATAKTLGDLQAANYNQALQTAVGQRAMNQADLQRALAAGQAMGQIGSQAGQLRQADLGRMMQGARQIADIGTMRRNASEQQQQLEQADLQRALAAGQLFNQNANSYMQSARQEADMGFQRQKAFQDTYDSLYKMGSDLQKTEQAGKDALFNQYLQQKAYPFEVAQFLVDSLGSLGPNYGSTTAESGSGTQLSWSDPGMKTGVGRAAGGAIGDGRDASAPEVVGRTFDGQDIYRYRYKAGGPAQLGLMADEVAPAHPDAVENVGGLMAVDYARATDDAAGLGHAIGANTREGFASGGGRRDPEVISALAAGRTSFIPKSTGPKGGRMMTSSPRGAPSHSLPPDEPKKNRLGVLKELAGNAQGLYQAFKGLGGMSGLAGAFDTAATSAASLAPAAATAAAAPAAAVTAAAPALSLGEQGLGFLDKLFYADGGAVPAFGLGGFATRFDDEDDRRRVGMTGSSGIVPDSAPKPKPQMPVSKPDREKIMGGGVSDGGGGQEQSGIGQIADMATKGLGAMKGLTGIGSAVSGASAAGGLAGLAGGAGGILQGVMSFLPFLGLFSDPSMKTGVGGGRSGYAYGGVMEDEERHPLESAGRPVSLLAPAHEPARAVEHVAIPEMGAPRSNEAPVMVASRENPNFADDALPLTLKREGGYTPNDAGAGASNMGINRRAHPGEDIEHMTKDRAGQIYKHDYWDAIGADRLDPKIRLMAYDAAVNQGPARARKWAEESGGDPQKLAALRMAHYQSLIDQSPGKYGPYARAWAGRVNADLDKLGLPHLALHSGGKSFSGGASGPEAPSGGADPRSYMALAEEDPQDRAVKAGLAVLSGVAGGLAGAEEGGALGGVFGGLSSAGGAYGKIASADLEHERFNWQKQRDIETMGMERAREGRAAEQYERDKRNSEETRKALGAPTPEPTRPAGGYGPAAEPPASKPAPATGVGGDPAPTVAPAPAPAPAPVPAPAPAPANPPGKDEPYSITPKGVGPEESASAPATGVGSAPAAAPAGLAGAPVAPVNPAVQAAQPVIEPVQPPQPVAPVTDAPRNLPASGPNLPKPAEFWPTIIDDQNPYALRAKSDWHEKEAARLNRVPGLQGAANEHYRLAEQYRQDSLKWANAPMLTDFRGNTVENPYVVQTGRRIKAEDQRSEAEARELGQNSPAAIKAREEAARREAQVRNDNELITRSQGPDKPVRTITKQMAIDDIRKNPDVPFVQEEPKIVEKQREHVQKKFEEMGEKYAERPYLRVKLENMAKLLETFQSGKFAGKIGEAAAALEALGIQVPENARTNASALQRFAKDSYGMVMKQAQETSNRILQVEIQTLVNSNPNIEMQPDANRHMLAQSLGIAGWNDQFYEDFRKWYEANPYAHDDSGFTTKWIKEHPLDAYVAREEKKIFAVGSKEGMDPTKQSAPIPAPLETLRESGRLQRKGDLFRDKETGAIYDKNGERLK